MQRCLLSLGSALAALALAACGGSETRDRAPAQSTVQRPDSRLCGDPAVVTRLRELIIARARLLKASDATRIEQVGREADVQVGDVVPADRDSALDLTVCRARLTFALPAGAVDAFDGGRELAADLRYAVQRTAGGGLAVHQLEGAEPLAMRLAAVPLRMSPPPVVARAPEPDARPAPSIPRETRLRPVQPAPPRRGLTEPALTSRGRPSFDCRRAGSRVERMICGDERLAALDRVTVSLYARTVARSGRSERAVLRQSQARFLARRDDCRRAGCVADRYRDRLDEIDRIAGR